MWCQNKKFSYGEMMQLLNRKLPAQHIIYIIVPICFINSLCYWLRIVNVIYTLFCLLSGPIVTRPHHMHHVWERKQWVGVTPLWFLPPLNTFNKNSRASLSCYSSSAGCYRMVKQKREEKKSTWEAEGKKKEKRWQWKLMMLSVLDRQAGSLSNRWPCKQTHTWQKLASHDKLLQTPTLPSERFCFIAGGVDQQYALSVNA